MKESIFLLRTLQLLSYGVAKESGSLWYSLRLTWWHPVYMGLGPALTWTGLPNQWLDSISLKIVLSLKKTRPFKYYFLQNIFFFQFIWKTVLHFLDNQKYINKHYQSWQLPTEAPPHHLYTLQTFNILITFFVFVFVFVFSFLPLLLQKHFQRVCTEEKLALKYCTVTESDKGAEL